MAIFCRTRRSRRWTSPAGASYPSIRHLASTLPDAPIPASRLQPSCKGQTHTARQPRGRVGRAYAGMLRSRLARSVGPTSQSGPILRCNLACVELSCLAGCRNGAWRGRVREACRRCQRAASAAPPPSHQQGPCLQAEFPLGQRTVPPMPVQTRGQALPQPSVVLPISGWRLRFYGLRSTLREYGRAEY